jgi:HAD superfamily hydrolase (TIGR01509 family)
MTTAPIRAVVLDVDGLMLDTEGISRVAWQRALAEWGLSITDGQYLQLIGRTVPDVGKIMRAWFGADTPFDSIYARKLALVDEAIAAQGIPQKAGLAEFLAAVDALGLRKAVATSTARERALYKIQLARVPGTFDAVAGGDEVANGKPAPDLFLLAARRLGIPPQECLAFEDSDAGAVSAHAAGMRLVIVPDQKPPSTEASAAAWRIIPDLNQAARNLPEWVTGGE